MPKKAKTKPVIGCWGFALIVFLIVLVLSYLDPPGPDSSDSTSGVGSELTDVSGR